MTWAIFVALLIAILQTIQPFVPHAANKAVPPFSCHVQDKAVDCPANPADLRREK